MNFGQSNKQIIILDTKAILHTIKYSLIKNRIPKNEKNTFIIYGFLLKLNFLLRKTKANIIVFALDSKNSKRQNIYAEYKGNRQDKTQQQIELDRIAFPQFDAVIDYVIPTIGYKNIFMTNGLEADDVIGSVCKRYKKYQITICSTDHDLYQLLTKNVCILDAKTNQYYTKDDFEEEYKIKPKMWKRIKAIGGCSSDNIKGVPIPINDSTKKQKHVAEKGALNYIRGEMGINTKAYKAIESKEGKKVINRNKSLVILPFKGTPKYTVKQDYLYESGLKKVCEKYNFESILKDFRFWKRTLNLGR